MPLLLLLGILAVEGASDGDDVRDLIDRGIASVWEAENAVPAPAVDDPLFFRRIHLDVLGRLPRPEEIRAFVKETAADKRQHAVDRLLADPEAARHWADRWMRLLLTDSFREADPFFIDFQALHRWLERAWTDNLPYDRFVASLLAAEGERVEHPETNFLVRHVNEKEPPVELTSRVARLFLGLQLQCAQCHDHPYDPWTQDDFWGMTAFFGNLRNRTRKTFDGMKSKLVQLEPVETAIVGGEAEGRRVTPRFLDGRTPAAGEKPRAELTKFLATMEGRLFAKSFVNREWAHYLGRGFVEPVDRFSERNRPSHPELLDALALDFEQHGYDVRRFARGVLGSRAYTLSSRTVEGSEPRLFVRREVKPMGPIEALNSFEYALELGTFFQMFYAQFQKNKDLPEPYKNPVVFRIYLTQYVASLLAPGGRAPEQAKNLGSVRLALRLMNNKDLQGLVRAHWGHLKKTLEKSASAEERLEEMFLTLFSRPPDAEEYRRYLGYLGRRKNRPEAFEDVYWVLLNSPDFFFNH